MRLKELLDRYSWNEIYPPLVQLYPDQEENREGYREAVETLRTIQPVVTRMRIVIEQVFDEHTHEYYASVSGKDGTLRKDSTPEAFTDDEIGNQEVSYGIEFEDWAEWLGMEIDPDTHANYPELEIIGHCLWEMTYFGYTQEAIRTVRDEMVAASRNSEEWIPLEEAEQELDT